MIILPLLLSCGGNTLTSSTKAKPTQVASSISTLRVEGPTQTASAKAMSHDQDKIDELDWDDSDLDFFDDLEDYDEDWDDDWDDDTANPLIDEFGRSYLDFAEVPENIAVHAEGNDKLWYMHADGVLYMTKSGNWVPIAAQKDSE